MADPGPDSKRTVLKRTLLKRSLPALGAVGLVSLGLFAAAWLILVPRPWGLDSRNPERTSLMDQRVAEAETAGTPLAIRKEWVPLQDISPNLVRAVIVAEDYRFREHAGVDWRSLGEEVEWDGGETFTWWKPRDLASLARSLRYAWENRETLRGRSTITQQLAKNLYFGTDRSFLRKGIELVVARRLERSLSKDRILEIYLNVAEWGPGIFGAEAAAREYFGVRAASLDLAQAAALAGTLPHPLTSNPARSPSQMRWRQSLILARLAPRLPGAPELPPMPEGPFPEMFGGVTPLPEELAPPLDELPPLPPLPEPTLLPDTSSLPGTSPPPSEALLPDSTGNLPNP